MTKGTGIKLTLSDIQRIRIFFFTEAWKPEPNFPLEMLLSGTDLEVHFKRITNTHTPSASIQRTATASLFSFVETLFLTGETPYKGTGDHQWVNLAYKPRAH